MEDVLKALSKPFPASYIEWRPGATTRAKDKALALAYVDPRAYHERLNDVFGTSWSSERDIKLTNDRIIITVSISVNWNDSEDTKKWLSLYRTGVGDASFNEGADTAVTKADAQAFKRACVEYGLGAYLYTWGNIWVEFENGRFTKSAVGNLARRAESMTNNELKLWRGEEVAREPEKEKEAKEEKKEPTKAEFWKWVDDTYSYSREDALKVVNIPENDLFSKGLREAAKLVQQAIKGKQQAQAQSRPFNATTLGIHLKTLAEQFDGQGNSKFTGMVTGILNTMCGGEDERHTFLEEVWGSPSMKDRAPAEVWAMHQWLDVKKENGDYKVDPMALTEIMAIVG